MPSHRGCWSHLNKEQTAEPGHKQESVSCFIQCKIEDTWFSKYLPPQSSDGSRSKKRFRKEERKEGIKDIFSYLNYSSVY